LVDEFKYLVSALQDNGGIEEYMSSRKTRDWIKVERSDRYILQEKSPI